MMSQVVTKIEGVKLQDSSDDTIEVPDPEDKYCYKRIEIPVKEVDPECRPVVHVKRVIPTAPITYIIYYCVGVEFIVT